MHFRCESDGDCTSETLRGQFHKIGAMEEITATDFRQIAGDRARLDRPLQLARCRRGFRYAAVAAAQSPSIGSRILHRGCTGNAESGGGDLV